MPNLALGGETALPIRTGLAHAQFETIHPFVELDVAFPTADRLVASFEELGLLRKVTGQRRSRLFRYEPYLQLAPSTQRASPIESPSQGA
jgi:hypothetical protein